MTVAVPSSPRVLDVVARTLRELPSASRRGIGIVILVWIAVVALQVWDSSHQPGARGIAEFGSVLLGTIGFLLIGLAQVLRNVSLTATNGRAVRQVLMALPAVGAIGALLLASAIAMLIARIWLGASPALLVIAITYAVALLVALGIVTEAARRLYALGQEEAARATQMEARLADARLSALQTQMNPHFLFNALNTVAALTRSDPRAAEATVEHLADVLRGTLDRSQQITCRLSDEIRFVRAYLAVEKRRLGGRLSVDWQVPKELDTATVPSFSLQPLVENAIKHGISPRREGGRVVISAQQRAGRLVLAIADDGDGFDPDVKEGTGLANLRERLAVIYRGAASLVIDRAPNASSGARVIVDLPLQTATSHATVDR